MCEGDGTASPLRSITLAPCSLFYQFRARSSNLTTGVLSPPSTPPAKAAAETPSNTQEHTDTRTHIHAHSKTHSSTHSYGLIPVFSLMQFKCTHRHTKTHVCANSLIQSHAHSPTHILTDATTYSHTFPHEAHRYELTHLNAHHHTHVLTNTHVQTHSEMYTATHRILSWEVGVRRMAFFSRKWLNPPAVLARGGRRPNNRLC